MRPCEVAAPRVRGLDRLTDGGERVECGVIVRGDLGGSLPQPEMQHQRRHVVRQLSIRFSGRQQCAPHHDIGEQRQRRMRPLARVHQSVVEPRVIQQRIDPLIGQRALGLVQRTA
jgi:hypothetical protein